jgi:hypothetical protein
MYLIHIIAFFIIFTLTEIAVFSQEQKVEYSFNTEFPPLRFSQEDFLNILKKAREIIYRANKESDKKYVKESLTLGDGKSTIAMEGNFNIEGLKNAPAISTSVRYEYISYDSPISHISLDLHNYSELVVKGSKSEEVEALSLFLYNHIKRYSTYNSFLTIIVILVISLVIINIIIIILFRKRSEVID